MKILKYLIILIFLIFPLAMTNNAFSISNTVKAEHDYKLLLKYLRYMMPTIENFGNQEHQKKFGDLKILFQNASEEYYSQNFDSSYQKFFKVKEDLSLLMHEMASLYIARSKLILDSTSKNSFDIMIKYSKESGLINYVKKPFDPVENVKLYNEDEYHFFYHKENIERYLNGGYKNLEQAKRILVDPDIEFLKSKKHKTDKNINYILKSYVDIIEKCRQAKNNGIAIHKLIKINQYNNIILKYNLSSSKIDSIYDDRIPEDYKVDAIDCSGLIYSIEKKRLTKNQESRKN